MAACNPVGVMLLGFVARGEDSPDSDLDLLVVPSFSCTGSESGGMVHEAADLPGSDWWRGSDVQPCMRTIRVDDEGREVAGKTVGDVAGLSVDDDARRSRE